MNCTNIRRYDLSLGSCIYNTLNVTTVTMCEVTLLEPGWTADVDPSVCHSRGYDVQLGKLQLNYYRERHPIRCGLFWCWALFIGN